MLIGYTSSTIILEQLFGMEGVEMICPDCGSQMIDIGCNAMGIYEEAFWHCTQCNYKDDEEE